MALLRRRAREGRSEQLYFQRRWVYGRVFRENAHERQVTRMARALAAFLREKEILLYPEDLLAGHAQWHDFSIPDDAVPAHTPRPETGADTGRPGERTIVERFEKGRRIGLFGTALGGHVIGGYDRVLGMGLGAITETANAKLTHCEGAERDFIAACATVCQAATAYVLRYAEAAGDLAREADNEECRSHLQRIADACRWVATEPPRTFFEAVQLFWLTHEVITCEQPSGSLSLGRVDQLLYPYYARDLAAGALTRDEGAELIEALWVKFGALNLSYQNVVVGGAGQDGTYLANDVSLFCLRASRKLRMDQPLLSVRWHPSMPDAFWQEVQKLIETGTGFPALFNDEVAIAAKRGAGVPREDAENYAVVGCVELSVPGKEFSQTEGLRVNWAKVIELILNDGRCTVTGETIGLRGTRKLESIASFEEFLAWYKQELSDVTELGIQWLDLADRDFPERAPYPFLSATMEGCLESGTDVTAGGTVYNLSTVNGCGMANAADSLAAIRKIVFEERRASLPELAEALRRDLDGHEELSQVLAKRCPKYGNDDDDVDRILAELADHFCDRVESHRNPRGGRFQTGLYTVLWHARIGTLTGALPDGRRRGLALANGMSPSQGVDERGPTAVIRSNTKFDHRRLGNGMVLDLKFHPSFFTTDVNRKAFRQLVETYFRLGGMEIQFNVISRETLLEAQESPEQYRDLVVRVSGFSAYFVDLDEVCQNEIIARTEMTAI